VISNLIVRLIMFSAHMLPLIPLFTYIRDPCCCCNGVKCQGERDTSKVHLSIVKMKNKLPSKLMMKFHPLYHFKKLITRLVVKASYSKRASKQFCKGGGLLPDDLSSFVWLSRYMSLSGRITKSFLFPLIVGICLHAYEFEVKADEYEEILKYEVSGVYRK